MNAVAGLAHAQAVQGDDRIALCEEVRAVLGASSIHTGEITEALLAPYLSGEADWHDMLMQLEDALRKAAA